MYAQVAIFLVLANILDVAFTRLFLIAGIATEGNPIADYLITSLGWGGFMLYKVSLPLLVLYFHEKIPTAASWIKKLIWIAFVFYAMLMIYHITAFIIWQV